MSDALKSGNRIPSDTLLARLADARDLNVSERVRENLCAEAYTAITRLQQETLALSAVIRAERERADAAKKALALRELQLEDARQHVEMLTTELLRIGRRKVS